MAEVKYRLPPCAAYDIPAMEYWLEDMAAKGLHLAPDGFFGGVAVFEEGPHARVRYRLEATATRKGLFSNEYEPDSDVTELHRQMGWDYRARRDQFHIYVSSDPHAPELNTDPQVQALSIAALSKYLWKSLRDALILAALYLLLYFGDAIISGSIYLGTWRVALLAGLLLWDLGRQVRTLIVLSSYRRQLQSGDPLPRRTDSRSRDLCYLALGGVRKVLWLALAVSLAAHLLPIMADEPYRSLDAHTAPFPFATVEDLYPGAEVERMDGILDSEFYRWSDPLAPVCYDFSEYAEVSLGGETFDCYLTVAYHELRFEWAAERLTRELVSQSGANVIDQTFSQLFGNEPPSPTILDLPEANYAVWYHNRLPYLVVRKNNIVIRVHYSPFSGAPKIGPEALAELVLSHLR